MSAPEWDAKAEAFTTCCTYCGDFNECMDHVTPVAYNSVSRAVDHGRTVPCCNLCNTIAGDFPAQSVIEKAAFLELEYPRRYSGKLTGARWTREEIAELTGNLHNYIETRQFLKVLIDAKLKNLDRVINGYPPNPIRGAYRRKEVTRLVKTFQNDYLQPD